MESNTRKTFTALRGLTLLLLSLLIFAQSAPAQEKETTASSTPNGYRLDFSVHEVENGKRINTRNYTMLLMHNARGSLRSTSKVPVTTRGGTKYMDAGLNLDCVLREEGSLLKLHTTVEIESFLSGDANEGMQRFPVIREVRAEVSALVRLGKSTIIAKIDDTSSNRRYELEVTVHKEN